MSIFQSLPSSINYIIRERLLIKRDSNESAFDILPMILKFFSFKISLFESSFLNELSQHPKTSVCSKLFIAYYVEGWEMLSLILLVIYPVKSGRFWAFPGGSVMKNLPGNAGDTSLTPGMGICHMPQDN